MSYNIGLVSISFRGCTPEEIIKSVKDAGLSCIEWGSDVHAPKDDENRLEEICKLQEEYGISCSSYGTYFFIGAMPTDELEGYAKAAKKLKTNILRVWCGNKNSQDYTDKEKEALFYECKKAAEIAEKANVILCMECHNFTYTNTKESALELMQEINSPNFRMYWQPNQYNEVEENEKYAEIISSYTEHLHVFNWKGDQRFPLKDSIDTWKKYLNKFEGDRTLLLEFVPDDKIETLKIEAQALKEIIK